MRAKNYYKKYGKSIYDEMISYEQDPESVDGDSPSNLYNLLTDMMFETRDIINSRHCEKDEACYKVIIEQNQKWNVIARLFRKEYGRDIVKENAFLEYFVDKVPEVRSYVKRKLNWTDESNQ